VDGNAYRLVREERVAPDKCACVTSALRTVPWLRHLVRLGHPALGRSDGRPPLSLSRRPRARLLAACVHESPDTRLASCAVVHPNTADCGCDCDCGVARRCSGWWFGPADADSAAAVVPGCSPVPAYSRIARDSWTPVRSSRRLQFQHTHLIEMDRNLYVPGSVVPAAAAAIYRTNAVVDMQARQLACRCRPQGSPRRTPQGHHSSTPLSATTTPTTTLEFELSCRRSFERTRERKKNVGNLPPAQQSCSLQLLPGPADPGG